MIDLGQQVLASQAFSQRLVAQVDGDLCRQNKGRLPLRCVQRQ